jgi:hypothetical protein
MALDGKFDTPQITTIRDRLCVDVPWERAENVQSRFRTHGIETTLHLEPASRQARLELWHHIAIERVRALLAI